MKKGSEFILWFSDINMNSLPRVGGKAASLGEMFNFKLPIANGFCVTADAYKFFLEETNIKTKIAKLLKNLDVEETEELETTAKKVQEIILEQEIPSRIKNNILESYELMNVDPDLADAGRSALNLIKAGRDLPYTAVRSSATAEDLPEASFAGQQATYLNVKGNKNLLESVKKCWASLFTARAIYYRTKNNFNHMEVYLCVIIHKMINGDVSGVMFTANPTTNNEDEIMIEASYGVGETIVSGAVNPDNYIVNKEDLTTKSIQVHKKDFMITRDDNSGTNKKIELDEEKANSQTLDAKIIKELAEYGIKIEKHYKKPMDIEWGIERGKLYILQARPITTLKKETKETKDLKGEVILEGLNASPGIASGPVRLIKDISELGKLQQGDVLVTEMTNPDYVVAMKKASAIVTDEGGITCFGENTKILTNKGFLNIKNAYERIKDKEELFIFSYNYKNKKPYWKRIINTGKRKRKGIRVSVSQRGILRHNTIDITSDHKMYTYNNRNLIKKEIKEILENNEYLCLLEKLPELNVSKDKDKEAYLLGALLSDGYVNVQNHHTGNPRRGRIVFTQKETEAKKEFINTVKTYFNEVFDENFSYEKVKDTIGNVDGRKIYGFATDFICHKLQPALKLTKIIQNSDLWALTLHKNSSLNFLAGLIDGDGCFYNNRLHIYIGKENVLQATIISCLRLGIIPQVTTNRDIHHVQIVEKIEDILNYTKRVKGNIQNRTIGTKFFSAKQILGDIINKTNWKGKIKPYVKNNLILDSDKIKERILPMLCENKKLRNEIIDILNSNLRMNRINKTENLGEIMVYNLEVEANEELEHNYVVFTEKYTPLLVSNSHAAIVSRELGIPAVIGTEKATEMLQDEQVITVDGGHGKIYKGDLGIRTEKIEEWSGEKLDTKTKIYMNLGEPELAEKYNKLPFDGIGLMRLEFMITSYIGKHPLFLIKQGNQELYVKKLVEGISQAAKAISPRPIIIRFSDFKTNEYRNLEGGAEFEEQEDNPMIGWRGVSRYISPDFIEAFKLELEAIKKVREEHKNVNVMLPFVRNVEEVKKVLELIKEEGLERGENFKIFLMAEVPSIALIPEEFAKLDIDGVSIGSNDLTQLVLAVDRDSRKLGKLGYFDERNKAVLKAMSNILKTFKDSGKLIGICGQSVSNYPEIVEFLVNHGIDSVSVNPDVVAKTMKHVYDMENQLHNN